MGKSLSIRGCEIVCNLYDAEGNVLWDFDRMNQVLIEKSNIIEKYAYIIHDKDTFTEEESEGKSPEMVGTLKPPHCHLGLKFKVKQPQHIDNVAKWFGVAANFVEKFKAGWNKFLLYLTHLNAPEKFQYDPTEVIANFDYKVAIEVANAESYLTSVLERILSGEIREYNKTLQIDKMTLVYQAKKINEAFKVRSEYLQATQQNRSTEVIFITGKSGAGKTTLAKKIAAEKHLDYFISSGSNDILDGYGQQPCLIIDDVRPSCLGLSDLLKLLDNHTASSVKSRYKNKYLNCELVILTSVLDLDVFYSHVFENENEPITQLKRRCGTYITMDADSIMVQRWDAAKMHYSEGVYFKNEILSQYVSAKTKTSEQIEKEIKALLPFLTLDADPNYWENTVVGNRLQKNEEQTEFESAQTTLEGLEP